MILEIYLCIILGKSHSHADCVSFENGHFFIIQTAIVAVSEYDIQIGLLCTYSHSKRFSFLHLMSSFSIYKRKIYFKRSL